MSAFGGGDRMCTGLLVCILVCLLALVGMEIFNILEGVKSRFQGSLMSDLGQGVVSSGPGIRFNAPRTDTGITHYNQNTQGFLGGPEPPMLCSVRDPPQHAPDTSPRGRYDRTSETTDEFGPARRNLDDELVRIARS